jgi:hypothetical protein
MNVSILDDEKVLVENVKKHAALRGIIDILFDDRAKLNSFLYGGQLYAITNDCNYKSFWRFTPACYRSNALEFTGTYAHCVLVIIEKLDDNRLQVEFMDKLFGSMNSCGFQDALRAYGLTPGEYLNIKQKFIDILDLEDKYNTYYTK